VYSPPFRITKGMTTDGLIGGPNRRLLGWNFDLSYFEVSAEDI